MEEAPESLVVTRSGFTPELNCKKPMVSSAKEDGSGTKCVHEHVRTLCLGLGSFSDDARRGSLNAGEVISCVANGASRSWFSETHGAYDSQRYIEHHQDHCFQVQVHQDLRDGSLRNITHDDPALETHRGQQTC